ncbi:unnamed protein product, partial [marine sediment metagenome]
TVSNKGEAVFRKTITTVGNNRIIVFPEPVEASEVAIVVLDSKGLPVINKHQTTIHIFYMLQITQPVYLF